jgi:pantetheine-phosphate adenylyltransferase
MTKIGIYPGSFDPITLGHLDIIQRSLHVVDKLIIAVSNNKSKKHMISIDDRLDLINKSILSLPNDVQSKINIEKFDNLLVHYVKSKNASLIIRGLRAVSDFEYEFLMTGMNRTIDIDIETYFFDVC